jgi:hypothetical protein
MSEVRNLRRPRSDKGSVETLQSNEVSYLPPCAFLLEHLGVSALDVQGHGTASVSKRFLRTLIAEFAACARFDHDWYAETYPDVEGARLAGDIQSLHDHFKRSGYFEGRLSAELPFDPQFYRRHYKDIADSFPASDPEGMRAHFLTSGYFEGRAGTAEMLAEVERWQALVKE